MYDNITLSELIKELQKIEAEHGDKTVLSIGTGCGVFNGVRNPFTVNMAQFIGHTPNERVCAYIATRKEDKGKSYTRSE